MRYVRTLPVILVMVATLAACGSASSGKTSTTSGSPAATRPVTSSTAPVGLATIDVGKTKLGSILSEAAGRTVYMYVPDAHGSSSCYGQCAAIWPPVLTKGAPIAGTGATASLLGTTTRKDGTVQVTYDSHPLYLFAKDTAAGDANGQAVQQIWYVLNAQGAVIKTTP
jgi:predicted lipoprotein with Yx(FWY)xxD motif